MAKIQVLIAGVSAAGKSMSLRNLAKDNPKKVAYLSAEAGKSTPFANNFTTLLTGLSHPNQVFDFFRQVEQMPEIEYCVLDGFNYLCEMYETMVVNTATNTMQAWGQYADFIKSFLQQIVGVSQKKWIILAHNNAELTPQGTYRYYVPIKGSVARIGIESYFNVVVYAQRMELSKIMEMPHNPNLLHITPRDERLGYKHVFQVQPTKETADGRIRDLEGMWGDDEIFIDNDAELLMNHLESYYNGTLTQTTTPAVNP